MINVPGTLRRPHRLIADLSAAIKGLREDKGVLPLNYRKFVRVRASAVHIQRGLNLMDTLLKEFASRSYEVRIDEKNAETLLVLKHGAVSFRLDERTKRAAPPPPPPGMRGSSSYDFWRPTYALVGTGEFSLEFGKYRLRNCRHTWKDRPRRPLEAQLHEVMAMLPVWEEVLSAQAAAARTRAAREREEEEARLVVARRKEVLRRQRAKLVGDLQAWEQAQRIRALILAAEPVASASPEGVQWLRWACEQADALDPIRADSAELFDLAITLEPYFSGYTGWTKPAEDWWS